MKTPPILLGASLMFWGWQTGYLVIAAICGFILECSNFIRLKWDLSSSDFNRISDVCNLMFLGAAVYLFTSTRSVGAILILIKWIPIILFPLILIQTYSTRDKIDISAIFLFIRKKRKRKTEKSPIQINLTYPYFVVCVLSTSAANVRTFWFYAILFMLSSWALWPIKSKRYPLPIWITLLCLAGVGGYWGHIGLHKLQLALEEKGLKWFEDFIRADANPYRNRTAIGDIGELKLSDRIVFRVKQEVGPAHPLLLREASYNRHNASGWFAFRSNFTDVYPERDGIKWKSQPGIDTGKHITVSTYLRGGKGMLKLPNSTYKIETSPVYKMKQNQYGAVKVEKGPGLLNYQVRYGTHASLDSPPNETDLSIPKQEEATLSKIIHELGLTSAPPREVLKHVNGFFQQQFKYSLFQNKHRPLTTPITHFLLQSRSGHCEYFATATVLLLRTAGIPARYASGYSVQEFSRWENCFVVRSRHAHAWALVFIDGAWHDFDTTPPSWLSIEEDQTFMWESFYDFVSWFRFKFSEWRWLGKEGGITTYSWLLIIPIFLILARKLHFKKRIKRLSTDREKKSTVTSYPGIESEFYRIEKRLNEFGFNRYHWETLSIWLKRIKESHSIDVPTGSIDYILALHYRYRFDPKGITAAEKTLLKSNVQSWLEQSEGIKKERS